MSSLSHPRHRLRPAAARCTSAHRVDDPVRPTWPCPHGLVELLVVGRMLLVDRPPPALRPSFRRSAPPGCTALRTASPTSEPCWSGVGKDIADQQRRIGLLGIGDRAVRARVLRHRAQEVRHVHPCRSPRALRTALPARRRSPRRPANPAIYSAAISPKCPIRPDSLPGVPSSSSVQEARVRADLLDHLLHHARHRRRVLHRLCVRVARGAARDRRLQGVAHGRLERGAGRPGAVSY